MSSCNYKGKCESPTREDCLYLERCRLYEDYRLLARAYLALQREAVAQAARVRKLVERKANQDLIQAMMAHESRFRADEKAFLKDAVSLLQDHPIFEWAKVVKGLGNTGAFMLFHLNPFKAQTAGQAKAFFGMAPGLGLRSGQRAGFDPSAKGRGWLILRGVIMAGDSYYVPVYRAKKQYYLEKRGMAQYIKNPELCPDYTSCRNRLKSKARRLKREIKRPPCRAHVDNLAKRFLIGIILGNALEIMREHEGLPIENIRSHRNYIKPKSYEGEVPREELLENLRLGIAS